MAWTLSRRNYDFSFSDWSQDSARPVFTLAENGNVGDDLALVRSFMNDNVATQIDGLGHAVTGEDNHWYNALQRRSGAVIGGAQGRSRDDSAHYRARCVNRVAGL